MDKHSASAKPCYGAICRSSVFGFVLALCACGGGGGAGGPTTTATTVVTSRLSGQVLDRSGAPIAGVTVSVFHHNNNATVTAVTDALGAYSVSGLDTVLNADYAIYADKAGWGFYPRVSDTAAVISKFDFNGLYRTVMRFAAMPARDVTHADFLGYSALDRMASLARTGQTLSYLPGDDASVLKGVAWPGARFTDEHDGTVTDHLTGLVWLKDADCFGPASWASALAAAHQLASGSCGLSDGSTPGQWRMPNANELESLVDAGQSAPALAAGHPFGRVNLAQAYWSSTTYTALSSNALAIRFTDGRWINGIDSADGNFNNSKSGSANALWAVKSGAAGAIQTLATGAYAGVGALSYGVGDDASLQLGAPFPSPRFIDKGDGTVADTVTGLIWLKLADCIHQPWAQAIGSINALASGACGLSDGSTPGQWRMPNRSEMLSLSDRAPSFPQADYFSGRYQGNGVVSGPVIFDHFIVSDYYWTSTTDAADALQAWTLYSCDFGVYNVVKTELRYALAVR